MAQRMLFDPPATIFEWFRNQYYASPACDGLTREEGLSASLRAWSKYRRHDPAVLQHQDRRKVAAWLAQEAGLVVQPEPEPEPEPEPDLPASPSSQTDGEAVPEAGAGAAAAAVAAEPSCGDDDGDDEELVAPAVVEERGALEVRRWSPAELKAFVLALARRRGGKHQERMEAMAGCLFAKDVDGALVMAGRTDVIVQQCSGTMKWDSSILKREGNAIVAALAEEQARAESNPSYTARNAQLLKLFGSAPQHVRSALEDALQAVPSAALGSAVVFSVVCTRDASERCCAVDTVDEDVAKIVRLPTQLFKVVSVVTPDDPREVWHNMVYFARDGRWALLASVDFATHGSALPGHWHLNRGPLGEFVPHWGPRASGTFHGDPDGCPIWWQLIPEGHTHKHRPHREAFIATEVSRGA